MMNENGMEVKTITYAPLSLMASIIVQKNTTQTYKLLELARKP